MSKRVQAQKQAARMVREQLARERRRKRTLWITITVIAVLVVGGGIGYAIYQSQKPTTFNTPASANAAGDGIVTGSGPVSAWRLGVPRSYEPLDVHRLIRLMEIRGLDADRHLGRGRQTPF